MSDYEYLVEQIPIQYDLFALLTFTSIVLSLLIVATILINNKPENQTIHFLGLSSLLLAFIQVDFFLAYTGLMKYVPFFNNSTEVFILLLLPCLYFFIKSLLQQIIIRLRKEWIHFIVPSIYILLQSGIHIQSNALKLNNYIFGFHPHLSPLSIPEPTSWWFIIATKTNDVFHELLVFLFVVYISLSIQIFKKYNATIKKHFGSNKQSISSKKYNFSVYVISILILAALVTTVVFVRFSRDLGEQYIMIIPMVITFILGYLMMSKSHFFDKSWLLEKYHTSGLNILPSDILQKIIHFVETQEYYLQKNSSLKDLSTQLSLSPTYLSQVINHEKGQNFNDFINQYRIETAKKRLVDKAYEHLNIAGIGETVGFKSKSAFYTAFKKHTQFTPAAYAKMIKSTQNTPK